MLKKVGDGFQAQGVQVFRFLPLGVERQNFVYRHGQHFAVLAGFVFHFQYSDGAAAHHHTGNERHGRDDQHIHRVAVAGNGFGHVTVIGRVVHGGAHEAVHEYGACFLVHFVLHRVGVHRNFDDHVEGVGHIFARGNFV